MVSSRRFRQLMFLNILLGGFTVLCAQTTVRISGDYHDQLDNPINGTTVHYYRAGDLLDSTWTMGTGHFIVSFEIVGTADEPAVLTEYRLAQNYPNPFNPTTQIPVILLWPEEPASIYIL